MAELLKSIVTDESFNDIHNENINSLAVDKNSRGKQLSFLLLNNLFEIILCKKENKTDIINMIIDIEEYIICPKFTSDTNKYDDKLFLNSMILQM